VGFLRAKGNNKIMKQFSVIDFTKYLFYPANITLYRINGIFYYNFLCHSIRLTLYLNLLTGG